MLKIIRNWEKQDYLRDLQGNRGYGLQIACDYTPLKIYGAFTSESRTILYLFAQKIDDKAEIVDTFILNVNMLTYSDGQYIFTNTADFGGYLNKGVYFFEFNDGYETYYSEIFKVESIAELWKASGDELISGDFLISDLNIPTNGFYERLKTFSEGFGFVEYAE